MKIFANRLTLSTITVNSIYACTLVIAAQQKEILWIFDFVGEKQANCLERLLSCKRREYFNVNVKALMRFSRLIYVLTSIHVVAEEKIVGLGWKAPILEKSQQV
jgi:hypothetical protein